MTTLSDYLQDFIREVIKDTKKGVFVGDESDDTEISDRTDEFITMIERRLLE